LSLVAIPFAAAWLAAVFALKRKYSKILLDLISKDMLDLKALEETDMEQIFSGGKIESQLVQAFLEARGNRSLWYARLLNSLGIKNLDQHLLTVLKHQTGSVRADLLGFLSPKAGKEAADMLADLAASEKNPDIIAAALQAVKRLDSDASAAFDYAPFLNSNHPEINAHALIGLCHRTPEKYSSTIVSWLRSKDLAQRKAGIIAAGGSGNFSFCDDLKKMLADKENEPVLPDILNGLYALGATELNERALPYLSNNSKQLRQAALAVIEIENDALLRKTISMMAVSDENIFELAKKKIETAPHQNTQLLVESLVIPNRKIRKGIFDLLESLNIKNLDIFRFAQSQVKESYQYLANSMSLKAFQETASRNLLIDHFNEKMQLRIENILRVLALQDPSGEIKIIYRGLLSRDARKRSNAIEALDDMVDKRLFKIMLPLMEIHSPKESLNAGKRNFDLMELGSEEKKFFSHLLADGDWVTTALTLNLIHDNKSEHIDHDVVIDFISSENKFIRGMARRIIDQHPAEGGQDGG
jgi:hypothetical protein